MKGLDPMLVREAGRVRDCKDEQSSKARSPMLVRDAGRVRDCKDE